MANNDEKYLLLKRCAKDRDKIAQNCEVRFVTLRNFLAFGEQFIREGWECGADENGQPVLFEQPVMLDGERTVNRIELKDALRSSKTNIGRLS